ncbi:uncharacterized protein F4822DRAFT_429567 [Hypoxylon trugodes]|uniref:uncharacterized protein n=1 Tax=Hypoxylon trugodes TaxID=326681 RepID=UPI00218DF2E7|nr:uncharacterized protein F4822DRAFT_429567 [Hypoxylon trugodes]KAI1388951.1 hypothetical protein F4822DRAFT_429567 [Hypoxylon trugodes]
MATITPYKRELPLLHRAWKTAIDHLSPYNMGIKLSSTNGDNAVSDDHVPRAAKRRRLTDSSPEAILNSAVSHILPEGDDDFEKALRVEILQIAHKDNSNPKINNLLDGTGSPTKKDNPTIRVRCKLSIFRWRATAGEVRILYCDSQLCNLKMFRDSDGICRRARIYLNSPFHIPAQKIYVEREDDNGFDLSDDYLVQAELESAGDPNWPPVDLLPREEIHDMPSSHPQHWVLSSRFNYRFEKPRASVPVQIRKRVGTEPTTLDLIMDMDLRWSTCHRAGSTTEVEASPPEVKPSIPNGTLKPLTNGHMNERVDNAENDPPKDDQDVLMDDDEDHEEAATPSRSLRTRGKQNYNLKLLSDKARGKERKEQKKQRKLADTRNQAGQITWILPHTGEIALKNLQCIRCFAVHSSMGQLEKHVRIHPEFKYEFDSSSSRIWVSQHGQVIRRRSSSLLEVQSSEGAESDSDDDMSLDDQRTLTQPRSSQPMFSTGPKDPRQRVPNNKQPMYDRLSKALLEPGSLVDPPEIDDGWLVQKHRDIIRDYSDVHPDEKEYIAEWDAFVNRECVTSEPHLQIVYLKFVQEKAAWLAATQSRMTEFSKHLSYLKARNSLAESTIAEALAIMRQVKPQKRPEPTETTKPPSPRTEYRKSASGCADCDTPLYHVNCIQHDAKVPVKNRNWRCNGCCGD